MHYSRAYIGLPTLPTSRSKRTRRCSSTCAPPYTLPKTDHASASKIPWPIYNPVEDIEPFERYTAGGYYPVGLGDRSHTSRYHVVHKLGYGASSTTWLARDQRLAKYVALKIAVSDLEWPPESAILKELRDGERHMETPHHLVPEILDEFEVEGPEIHGARGKHRCLVMTPAKMGFSEAREGSNNRLFQPPVARAIAAQLMQAVAFMHSCGIVHGGECLSCPVGMLLRLTHRFWIFMRETFFFAYPSPSKT